MKEKEKTKYLIYIYTPDKGKGGTDKAPILIWGNDIGVVNYKVKYSGGSPSNAFERNTFGQGTIESDAPLENNRLYVTLTNDGGADKPDWRLEYVQLTWQDGDEIKCRWFYFWQPPSVCTKVSERIRG